jgi:hypothetical protein
VGATDVSLVAMMGISIAVTEVAGRDAGFGWIAFEKCAWYVMISATVTAIRAESWMYISGTP